MHLELDDFEPTPLDCDEHGIYTVVRAMPPTKQRFFFSYRGYAQIAGNYGLETQE